MKQAPWAIWKTIRRSTLSLWTFASLSPATLSCSWCSWYRVSCTTAEAKIPPRSTPRTRSQPSLPSGWWWCRALQPRWDGGTQLTWSQPTTSQHTQTSERRKAPWSEQDSDDSPLYIPETFFYIRFFLHFLIFLWNNAWIWPTQDQTRTVRVGMTYVDVFKCLCVYRREILLYLKDLKPKPCSLLWRRNVTTDKAQGIKRAFLLCCVVLCSQTEWGRGLGLRFGLGQHTECLWLIWLGFK